MVADWNCGERGGAKVSTQPYQSKLASVRGACEGRASD